MFLGRGTLIPYPGTHISSDMCPLPKIHISLSITVVPVVSVVNVVTVIPFVSQWVSQSAGHSLRQSRQTTEQSSFVNDLNECVLKVDPN